jgi:hypothetical protein
VDTPSDALASAALANPFAFAAVRFFSLSHLLFHTLFCRRISSATGSNPKDKEGKWSGKCMKKACEHAAA